MSSGQKRIELLRLRTFIKEGHVTPSELRPGCGKGGVKESDGCAESSFPAKSPSMRLEAGRLFVMRASKVMKVAESQNGCNLPIKLLCSPNDLFYEFSVAPYQNSLLEENVILKSDLHVSSHDDRKRRHRELIRTNVAIVNYSYEGQPMKPPYVLGMVRLDGADNDFRHFIGEVDLSDLEKAAK